MVCEISQSRFKAQGKDWGSLPGIALQMILPHSLGERGRSDQPSQAAVLRLVCRYLTTLPALAVECLGAGYETLSDDLVDLVARDLLAGDAASVLSGPAV